LLLHEFAIKAPIRTLNIADRLLSSPKQIISRLREPICGAIRSKVVQEDFSRLFYYQHVDVPQGTRLLYLNGYFQNYSIVRAVEAELRNEFALRKPLSGKNLEMADRITSQEVPVSVHFRRGDYLTELDKRGIPSYAYYENAFELIRRQFRKPFFFLFSDDPVFANSWATDRANCVAVNHNGQSAGHEDLRLMSLCKHHVIANSTFSWWGAWLNPRTDKQVIAPSRWLLKCETASIEIIPREWLILES